MQAMTASLLMVLATLTQTGSTNPIPKQELEYQQQAFKVWWGQPLVFDLSELPTEASVADYRIPYSGYDYPDRAGGTINAMVKYDMAFNSGQRLATEYERRDVGNHRDRPAFGGRPRFGLFARLRESRDGTRSWYGHCNGWTAAAIRHAEPQFSVRHNGVIFTPADIKGLLAEIYMYTDTEFLGGVDAVIHPAVFHVSLTNWLGRGNHPIGMETAVGEVVINYPIYAYKSVVNKLNDRQSEVKMTINYAMNTNHEVNQSPRVPRQLYFHYVLDLDREGNIIGGRYYNDSARIDMLWAPLKPVQGGEKGNERGNPHVDVKKVLAIWRASVPEDVRQKWLNIDPPEEDRIQTEEEKSAEAVAEATADKPESTETEKPAEASTADSGEASAAATAGESARESTAPPTPEANRESGENG